MDRPPRDVVQVAGFCRTTRIKTMRGEVAADTLRRGDQILTRDNGYQALLWTGHYRPRFGFAASVRLRKGALGPAVPERGLLVGRDQQFLIGGDRLQDLSGLSEALVSAVDLTCLVGVSRQDRAEEPLVLILLARHELILANGTWCASFRPTAAALKALPPPARNDLSRHLAVPDAAATPCPAARQRLDRAEVRRVLNPFRRTAGKKRSGHA